MVFIVPQHDQASSVPQRQQANPNPNRKSDVLQGFHHLTPRGRKLYQTRYLMFGLGTMAQIEEGQVRVFMLLVLVLPDASSQTVNGLLNAGMTQRLGFRGRQSSDIKGISTKQPASHHT